MQDRIPNAKHHDVTLHLSSHIMKDRVKNNKISFYKVDQVFEDP